MTSRTIGKCLETYLMNYQYKMVLHNIYLFSDDPDIDGSKSWESDVLGVTPDNRLVEFEIKISKSDFHADFKKEYKHQQLYLSQGPSRFSFICPDGLIKVDELPDFAGLYYVYPQYSYRVKQIKAPPLLNNNKIDIEYWEKIAQKLYWKQK